MTFILTQSCYQATGHDLFIYRPSLRAVDAITLEKMLMKVLFSAVMVAFMGLATGSSVESRAITSAIGYCPITAECPASVCQADPCQGVCSDSECPPVMGCTTGCCAR